MMVHARLLTAVKCIHADYIRELITAAGTILSNHSPYAADKSLPELSGTCHGLAVALLLQGNHHPTSKTSRLRPSSQVRQQVYLAHTHTEGISFENAQKCAALNTKNLLENRLSFHAGSQKSEGPTTELSSRQTHLRRGGHGATQKQTANCITQKKIQKEKNHHPPKYKAIRLL